MESLWVLIPLSVLLAIVIGAAFWWAGNSGQFDDLDSPAKRILIDDDRPDEEAASGRK
jgi:cbb3-type cytochrome oxidase maturation protein